MNQSNLSLVHTAQQALSMMDLTSLNDEDCERSIHSLCQQALTPYGAVAAVCVYPRFISVAKQTLQQLGVSEQVAIATVVNFPHGQHSIADVEQEIREAVAAGANEIDLVLPYRQLIAGDSAFALSMVQAAKGQCVNAESTQPVLLKVIIESGELQTAQLITQASELAIQGSADFIKTSTGKVAVNATLPAAELMLTAIANSGREVGFKAAGGVRTTAEAQQYLQLAAAIMGEAWLTPAHMRFGASSLLAQLLETVSGKA